MPTNSTKIPTKRQQRLYFGSRKLDQLRERVLDWANSRTKPFSASECSKAFDQPFTMICEILDFHVKFDRIIIVREPLIPKQPITLDSASHK
jgi:hypothetical protein